MGRLAILTKLVDQNYFLLINLNKLLFFLDKEKLIFLDTFLNFL